MKKVIVRVKGGLGNQLFMYSFAKAYALRTKSELIIDDLTGFGKHDIYKSEYILNHFSVPDKTISQTNYKYIIGKRRFWSLLRKLKYSPKYLVISEKNNNKHEDKMNVITSGWPISFIEGYWHSPRYFQEYKKEIKASLCGKEKLVDTASALPIIGDHNYIAVGLRFFQELDNPPYYHKMVAKKFYKAAIDEILSKVKNAYFVVFSNDEKRANAFFDFDVEKKILHPSGNDFLDFRLMQSCKHFLISNSTFHWWAAWLGSDEDSIVIVPNGSFRNKDMMPNEWFLR
jgi:hypothetical protein